MTADNVFEFKRKPRFTTETFRDIKPRSQRWLVKKLLPMHGVAFIVGQTKAGKSFVALDASLRIASGFDVVLGRRTRQAGVVYVAAEDPNGCRERIVGWRLDMNWSGATLFELIGQTPDLRKPDDMAALLATISEAKQRFEQSGSHLGVVVIDTLSRAIPGADENSSADMSAAYEALEQLSRDTGALVLVVAHFGKGGSDRGIRGWSGLDANSDATIVVERDKDEPERRTVTLDKVKNGVDGGTLTFHLRTVSLGYQDEDGEDVTTCVCEFEGSGERKAKRSHPRPSPKQEVVLRAVRIALDEHGGTVPFGPTVPPGVRGVLRERVKETARAIGYADDDAKPESVRRKLNSNITDLIGKGLLGGTEDHLWLIER